MDGFRESRYRDDEHHEHSLPYHNKKTKSCSCGDRDGSDDPLISRHAQPIDDDVEPVNSLAYLESPRRRPWLTRLLMSLRQRRSFKKTSSEDIFKPRKTRKCCMIPTRLCGIFIIFIIVNLALIGMVHIWDFVIGLGPALWDDADRYWLPKWGQPGEPGEYLSHYPTDATRDVMPLPIHSHNDYWRRIPLYEALHYGCTGVEADVWLFDEELYVGHNTASLTKNRTFQSLYINPIREMLDKQNPVIRSGIADRNGVFETDPMQTLVLLVDFKNNGRTIFPYVSSQLSALRDKGYLTYFDGTKVVPGAVTVVGTGNTPFDLVKHNTTYRDIFFDAPLDRMWAAQLQQQKKQKQPKLEAGAGQTAVAANKLAGEQGTVGVTTLDSFDPTNSYYASVNFKRSIGILWMGRITPPQLATIRGQIRGAHARGLKVRYWNTPGWPVGVREHVWRVLWEEGADMLNVDELRAAAKGSWWKRGGNRG